MKSLYVGLVALQNLPTSRVCRKLIASLNIDELSEIYNGRKDDASLEFVYETERNNCIGIFAEIFEGCRYIQLIWQKFFSTERKKGRIKLSTVFVRDSG